MVVAQVEREAERREIVPERCFSMEILRSSVIVAMGAFPLADNNVRVGPKSDTLLMDPL